MDKKYDALFTPWKIGNCEIKIYNDSVSTSISPIKKNRNDQQTPTKTHLTIKLTASLCPTASNQHVYPLCEVLSKRPICILQISTKSVAFCY